MATSLFEVDSSTQAVKKSYFQCTAGTSGAVPSTFDRARDIASVVKGTNTYVFTLSRGCTALLGWQINVIQASYSKTGACKGEVFAEDVASANKSITVKFFDGDGDPVDLAAGDVLRCTFDLKLSPGKA